MQLFKKLFENYEKIYNIRNVNIKIKRIGIFPGAFKPPTKGHFEAAKIACQQNDEVYVIISPVQRDNITAKQSKLIWKIYAKLLPKLKIIVAKDSPVTAAYELVDSLDKSPNASTTIVKLYSDKDDMGRFANMSKFSTKLKRLSKFTTKRICSARDVRLLISTNNKDKALVGFPREIDREKIWNVLKPHAA